MPVYTPVITVSSTPALEVTAAGLTYEELKNSFGSYNYFIKSIFIQALSIPQTLEELTFESYDSNGQQYIRTVTPPVDPYQYQPSICLNVCEQNIMINGRTSMQFNILPLETVSTFIFAERDYISEYLEKYSVPNKMMVR